MGDAQLSGTGSRRRTGALVWAPDVLSVAIIAALYLALELPTVGTFGILWDEQNDLDVARSYLSTPAGWLAGSAEDPTQTRLPMYTAAVLFALTGHRDQYT